MAKTITIIELLNKIANEEEVPRKVKFNKDIFEYYPNEKEYKSFSDEDRFIGQTLLFPVMVGHRINEILHCKVEIIEDEQEIDIQNIEDEDLFDNGQSFNDFPIVIKSYDDNFNRITKKLNELVQAVKYLDNKLKEK